jgi:hypothetical protein
VSRSASRGPDPDLTETPARQAMIDRQAIVDTIVRWAMTLDAKDWTVTRNRGNPAIHAGARPQEPPGPTCA